WLRSLRHDRQCLGVDYRLVFNGTSRRRTKSLLYPGKPARRTRGGELRFLSAEHQDSSKGCEGRLAFLCPQLLPPLSPGRAPCTADRHIHEPCRLSVHNQRERVTP